ncbi:MAG: isoprenylcysteine carboxylmethyltransferase family protein [Acidimicrobiia bacterium]|nr:isoprenylcysteine carboxylmethyltransferase family protein [Acidimicrobiia bacterium]
MAIGALIGFSTLVVLAFGFRTVLHRRRTGRTGWLVSPTSAARVGDGLATIGVFGTLLAPTLHLLDIGAPLDASSDTTDGAFLGSVGLVLLIIGSVTALVAQAQMGTAWRAGIDLSANVPLVRSGLFAVVRNPFYLGFIVASAGVVLMVPGMVSLVGWMALVAGCEIDVRLVEEPHLRSVHPAEYAEYVEHTPRFVPIPRSLRRFGRSPGQ